ncbi:squalene synthetase-like protein [Conoideocrella luteorostrata]|uniref:Squalene synthetase-like protein n=1 Tax=Conoideocrella luteorostrata TaxID=1105319 RepID=A0AAJ0CZJ7_9HYPO|nr:squalene synthetase-like protein [Conoideocrella luteorostrata]
MDFHARKVIHELADKFNIKSKSTGKADQRRPTLYRTIRTLPYAEAAFDQAINRIQRRFLPRLDTKGKRNTKPNTTRCVTATAASYREGEIVGAAAPELGLENRGRAMLEKMGWCRGTALGATNNKGILLPVTHAMKKSKAGLG